MSANMRLIISSTENPARKPAHENESAIKAANAMKDQTVAQGKAWTHQTHYESPLFDFVRPKDGVHATRS